MGASRSVCPIPSFKNPRSSAPANSRRGSTHCRRARECRRQYPGELTAFLMDRPYRSESTPIVLPHFGYRASQGPWTSLPFGNPAMVWPSVVQQPAKDGFQGKLALLVDVGCNSSCEDFTMPFQDNGRAQRRNDCRKLGSTVASGFGRRNDAFRGCQARNFP
jgi:hypothetical protein